MDIKRLLTFVLVVVALYSMNYYYFEMPLLPYTGILLLLWILGGFLSVMVMKFYKKKRGIPQVEDSYVFPDLLAKMMKNVDIRTQYEASLLSICFILIGLVAMAIYTVTFIDLGWWPKGMIIFNTFWGFVFLSSFLVTNYQQYVSYLETQKIMADITGSTKDLVSSEDILSDQSLPPLPMTETETETENLKPMKGGQ